MKFAILAVALLASLSAYAQTRTERSAWLRQIERADEATTPYELATRYVRNANTCAPDQSRAVWGSGEELLGYACYNEPGRW